MTRDTPHRPRGLKLIIAYKCVKAPLVLGVALFLTLDPQSARHALERFAHDLSEGGALLGHLARWLEAHLTGRTLGRGAIVAWLDGVTTSLEAFLLWRGRAWGEWIVVVGLAALMPFELFSLERHPTLVRLAALVLNAAIVGYLAWLRVRAAHRAPHGRRSTAP